MLTSTPRFYSSEKFQYKIPNEKKIVIVLFVQINSSLYAYKHINQNSQKSNEQENISKKSQKKKYVFFFFYNIFNEINKLYFALFLSYCFIKLTNKHTKTFSWVVVVVESTRISNQDCQRCVKYELKTTK